MKKSYLLFFVLLLYIGAYAQEQEAPKVVQFSGIILAEDNITPMIGVNVYVPKYWRGTTTNIHGFFSMPVVDGDSVVVSFLGYEKRFFKIRASKGESQTILIALQPDTTYLPVADIYPTETQLKEAILAMNTPYDKEYANMKEGVNPEIVEGKYMPMSAKANSQYFARQQLEYMNNRGTAVSVPLLNPFAWMSFIRSLQNK